MASKSNFSIQHHGAVNGVTGSCHELRLPSGTGILVDCGLFQGDEDHHGVDHSIGFPVGHIRALVVTHVHLDHVGRIPYLLAAGFSGPIFCSPASAQLLPLVLEDAVKVGVGVTRNRELIDRFLQKLKTQIVPLACGAWHDLSGIVGTELSVKLKPAGHILGSVYVECRAGRGTAQRKIIFSGDLGAPYTPLLPAPKAPYSCETLVLESTYGDRNHEGRRERKEKLRAVLESALSNRGTVLIPAFSIGRTQELLYELEELIHRHGDEKLGIRNPSRFDPSLWRELEIIVDSPLASRFTTHYRQLWEFWDAEAKKKCRAGRHPLAFEKLTTIDSHGEHLDTVAHLARQARPAIVLAASGMCAGGRIVNYLKAMLGDPRHDVLFVGYQAAGTPGRAIQQYGPRSGYVMLDGKRYTIRAGVHSISGYSAHAGQKDLIHFVKRMRRPPREIRLVHGDGEAKKVLKEKLHAATSAISILIP